MSANESVAARSPQSPGSHVVESANAADARTGDITRIGRYVIQETLGKGGFGTVYLAYDETLRRKVAIKAPRLELSTREVEQEFLTEARQLARLKHPGIVGVLDVVSEAGRCYIISDFVEGPSLASWLKTNQPDWRQAAQICGAIADALAHAHAQRTVHRDLKPANVIMTAGHQPVIVDFGLAVSDAQRASGTDRGDVSGTPGYMSPEQAAGAGHRIDGRTDIYSLGVILYRLLTGRVPFAADSMIELLRQVRDDEPQPPRQIHRELPVAVEQICLKAMAKSLRERYTTADDFARDLRTALTGSVPLFASPVVGELVVQAETVNFVPPNVPRVAEPVSSSELPASSRRRQASQRRQVTIVNCGCDVFENDAIQESLDADELVELLQAFQKQCREIAVEFGGSVLQDTDDGVAVCFGFPRAFEDSVPRAVRFGMAVQQRVAEIPQIRRLQPVTLGTRVVMHTDVAVVEAQANTGDSASSVSVVGAIRNFTSRLDQLAEIGAVLVSDQTQRVLRGLFETESRGEQRVKGLSASVTLYRIVRERSGVSRVELAEPAGLTPLIGRDREIGLLQERWEQAVEGMGQVVLLIGEAGLGKSRLIHSLKRFVLEHAASTGDPIIEWRASQQRQNSSLYPAIECIEHMLGIEREDSPATQLDKLIGHLQTVNLDGDVETALLASLLSIPLGDQIPRLALSPQQQREQTIQLLFDWLKELAARQPLLFVIEDLHWIDPTTLEFLELLVDQGLNDRILTLMTFRPEFETPWKSKAHQTNLALNRLTKRQVQELMEAKMQRHLPANVVEQIIERTDGVPLFVEEYTQMLVESDALKPDGDSSVSGLHAAKQIPASLQDMLMSRLDRIDCDLAVVQLAGAIGRTFSFELLRKILSDDHGEPHVDERELQQQLDKLVAAELLFVQGRPPRQRYQFKHALLQDAAYHSLIKAKRQEFHGRIAETLEEAFPEIAEREPEVLAQHFAEAGLAAKAVDYWQRAGERSLQRYAYSEAIQQIRAALEANKSLPESRERHLRDIELHIKLGVSLQSKIGYSAPEVEENYARALALCQQLKLTTELFPILYGLFRYCLLQANYAKSREIAEQLVTMAKQSPEPDFVVGAHRAAGATLVYQGRYAEAMPHLDQVLAIHASADMRSKVLRYDVVDPWIASGTYRSWTLCLMGYPQQAIEQSQRTMAEAEALRHPFTITMALSFSMWLHQFRRDVPATLAAAERALTLYHEHGFHFWIGWGNVFKHWSLGITGRDPRACEAIREGIAAWRAQGMEMGLSYFYAMQSEVALAHNHPTEAATALAQAEDFARATSEGFLLPDLHRLRGELALCLNDHSSAETHFRTAIETARQQDARSHELRSAISLARLLKSTSRAPEAREHLSHLLHQFTEGHDTLDLQEATELLNTL